MPISEGHEVDEALVLDSHMPPRALRGGAAIRSGWHAEVRGAQGHILDFLGCGGLHEDRGSEDSLLAVHVILLLHMLGEEGEQGARGKRPDSEQRKYGRT